jgi:hypothetical protein
VTQPKKLALHGGGAEGTTPLCSDTITLLCCFDVLTTVSFYYSIKMNHECNLTSGGTCTVPVHVVQDVAMHPRFILLSYKYVASVKEKS